MLYTAQPSSKATPATILFQQRGLTSFTQSTPTKLAILGKPNYQQLAYDGYKANLEAFLYATERKAKVTTHQPSYPLSFSNIPNVPLSLPNLIFKFDKQPSSEGITKMMERWEPFNPQKVVVGKGTPVYTLDSPSYEVVMSFLPKIALPEAPRVEARAQLNGSIMAAKLIYMIDLFLATHTYYFKCPPLADPQCAPENRTDISGLFELRVDGWWYRQGHSAESSSKRKKGNSGTPIEIDESEKVDMTPHRSGVADLVSSVFVAKPSPKPSSTNFGTPSSVPFAPGLLFPYFEGLFAPDTAFLRDTVGRHFFRLLGSDPRKSFLEFRQYIGTVSNTPQGRVLLHVMQGIELGIQCQAQVYLLFEEKRYLGFCLLGEEFSILLNGKWEKPLSDKDLQAELRTIQTHSRSLEDLFDRLLRCVDCNGDNLALDLVSFTQPSEVADALARVVINEDKDDEKEISEILARLSFSGDYRTFKPDFIAEDIKLLASPEPFPIDRHFYIPVKGWIGIDRKEYKIFASYGAHSFSFRNAKGTELAVNRSDEANPFEKRKDDGSLMYPRFLVGQKVVRECIRDWDALKASGKVRMDFEERAQGSRNHLYTGNAQKRIWDALVVLRTSDVLVAGKGKAPESGKPSDIVFGGASLEDLF